MDSSPGPPNLRKQLKVGNSLLNLVFYNRGLSALFFLHVNLDLGSANFRLSIDGKVIVDEPSLVAVDCNSGHIKAVGRAAFDLADKPLSALSTVYPIKRGRIRDFSLAEALLRFHLRKLPKTRRIKALVTLPASASSVDKICWQQLFDCIGSVSCRFVPSTLAAALGAGVDMDLPGGILLVDIGDGKTDISVLSANEIIVSATANVGSGDFSSEIARVLRRQYNISVSESVVETLKKNLTSAVPLEVPKEMKVNGFDLVSGLPCERLVSSSVINSCLIRPLNDIARAIQDVMLETPCELSADLVDSGIILVGGGALTAGIDKFLQEYFSIPVKLADDPQHCSVLGCSAVELAQVEKVKTGG